MPLDAFEPTLFRQDRHGNSQNWFPLVGQDEKKATDLLPASVLADKPPQLPTLSEPEVVRHFTRLSRKNFSIDSGFYPLGSCTMKYNPKMNEALVSLPGLVNLHPDTPKAFSQGTLKLMVETQEFLADLTGMKQVTLNPCAGAHGELCGMMMIRAYHQDRNDERTTVLVPDSAHGTNPATASMVGYKTTEVKSNADGCVDLDDLKSKLNPSIAAIMLTNPNTLGLFEKEILEIARLAHEQGALLYYDGANLNAIAGLVRPGDMGFDVVHINLHKTFATPHGGGGPGSGPVGVGEKLQPYLPVPIVRREGKAVTIDQQSEKSIGQLSTFFGNIGIVLRTFIYMRYHGLDGLRKNSIHAVLNARYMREKMKEVIPVAFEQDCMHEFVLTMRDKSRFGEMNAMVLAKNLIDRGFHAPTVYFPLCVREALMVEPTETESIYTLDKFIEAVVEIFDEYEKNPERVLSAPHTTPVRKLDEVGAARNPDLVYTCDD